MKKTPIILLSPLIAASLFAAPPAKGPAYETVAEGYCAWAGFKEDNFVMGRRLVPSDMRHKLALVIFANAEDFDKQVADLAKATANFNPSMSAWAETVETRTVPRDKIALLVLSGKPDLKAMKKTLSDKAQELGAPTFFIYTNVTGSKVPDNGGKLPFYCIFGPEPGDPLASGALDDAGLKKIAEIRRNKKYVLENWKPYCGTVEEPTAVKGYAKTLASGKPLEPLMATCYKGISSKDPEKAKECQILYDALEQTRSDLYYDVVSYAAGCPTRAFYEAQLLLKKWPRSKKKLQPAVDRIKNIPDAPQLCKMFSQLKLWGSEDFKCKSAGEAKKIEAELKKMKATCDGIVQKSNVNVIQSAAAWIANEADTLAPQMADKVQSK